MTQKITQLHGVDPDEYRESILTGVKKELANFYANIESSKKSEYLTRKEVASLIGVSLVTVHDWCNKNILNPYRIGNRVRFKRSEIDDVLKNSTQKYASAK